MRIAYVAIHLEKKYIFGGVGRKIQEHLRIWQQMGHEAHLFLHSPDDIQLPGTSTFQFGSTDKPSSSISVAREVSRSRALAQMIRHVAKFQPDIIYLRYGLFTFPLQRLYRLAPVIVEINADDVSEYRYRGRFFYWMNRLTRSQILKKAAGFVAVSREIAGLPIFSKFNKPTLVYSNGIDLKEIEPLPAPCNAIPRLAFVGNAGMDWNGVDKLIAFARRVPEIQVDVIGYSREDIPDEEVPQNVSFFGRVSVAEVREILSHADVACGTLALHGKMLQDSSALKVREALAYGIPVILACIDSDISGKGLDFVLQIPNTESNVENHCEAIKSFVFRMVGKRADRGVITPLIDQRIKEQKRFIFFEQFLRF